MKVYLSAADSFLSAAGQGLKSLCALNGSRQLVWQTVTEYSMQIEMNGEQQLLEGSGEPAQETVENGVWLRIYDHTAATVRVAYHLEDTTALKTITVTAKKNLLLRYIRTETATVNRPLSRGGEGQPLFVGEDGFVASTFPTAENQADGLIFTIRQAPFISLGPGEQTTLSPVVFGLNTRESMAESFWSFLLPRRPHPHDRLRIYCDWGAHDELADEDGPELSEAMAQHQLDNLSAAKKRTGLTFDYYLMDAYWFEPETYRHFKKTHWPHGPQAFIQNVEREGMRFGLWFDVNMQKITGGDKRLLRSGSQKELCMAAQENADALFAVVEKHLRQHNVRMLKFDFAYFACDNPAHSFHSLRPTASKEPAVRRFVEKLNAWRQEFPDLQVLAYNGFTTDLDYIGSVDPHRRGYAVSPFWALAVDYIYCGDPRPAENPAPLEKSLLQYTDCMIEQFRDALLPPEAIDDHGTMVGKTNTIYYLGKRNLRDSYLLNIVRGTRKCHLYGETDLLDEADWKFLSKAQALFDFVCASQCRTTPILDRPSCGRVYGYSNTDGSRGVITVVNCTAQTQPVSVNLPCWQAGDRLAWRRLYRDGDWCSEVLAAAGSLQTELAAFEVAVFGWERVSKPARSGYVEVDSGSRIRIPLPQGCRRVGLRFLNDRLSPLRAANAEKEDLVISTQGARLVRRDSMPIWSSISFVVYDLSDADDTVELLISRPQGDALTVQWQDMT